MIELLHGDCLELMKDIPNSSVDMVLCDLPYGVTQNKKDIELDPSLLWENYWRIIKNNGIIILFGQDKFTAKMMLSDAHHRYNLIWDKNLPSGFLNANRMPFRSHEDIMIFYKSQPVYNPQKIKGNKNHSKGKVKKTANNNYGDFNFVDNYELHGDMKYPKSILKFQKVHPSKALHRTEKSIELLEYLIKTYSHEGFNILDNCMGSGSTGVACINTGRNFIGIEKDNKYFEIAKNRIEQAQQDIMPKV